MFGQQEDGQIESFLAGGADVSVGALADSVAGFAPTALLATVKAARLRRPTKSTAAPTRRPAVRSVWRASEDDDAPYAPLPFPPLPDDAPRSADDEGAGAGFGAGFAEPEIRQRLGADCIFGVT